MGREEMNESNLVVFMEIPKDLCGAGLGIIYLEKLETLATRRKILVLQERPHKKIFFFSII